MREVGILLMVFGPLDLLIQGQAPSVLLLSLFVSCGLLLVTWGIMIEARE